MPSKKMTAICSYGRQQAVSEAAGGDFLEGAVAAAMVHLFNDGAKNLKWDSDGDGKLSLNEANNWWENGNGEAIDVDASKLTILDLESVDIVLGIEDYLVHGSVSLAPNGGRYESVYDFDYRIE